jgi:hypothetical protein
MRTRPGSIDAAIAPASWFWAGVIRVDDALGGAARCRHVALCQRGIGAFEVIVVPALVDLQADRIVRIIGLGVGRRHCRSHPDCQNRQSQNAHRNLFIGAVPRRGTHVLQLVQPRYTASVPVAGHRRPPPTDRRAEPGDGDIADTGARRIARPWSLRKTHILFGAGGGTRTHTTLPSRDFKFFPTLFPSRCAD